MKTRVYRAPGLRADELADKVRQWFAENDYETQILRTPDNHLVVQGYRDDLWRVAFGLATALTVRILPADEDSLQVDVGAGAWFDKAFVAGIGLLFFLPLVLPAAYGAFEQSRLDDKIFAVIEAALPEHFETVGTTAPAPVAGGAAVTSEPELPESWFNEETSEVYSVQFFQRMESWQRAIADGLIEESEIHTQSERVTTLLKQLEPTLSDEAHEKLSAVLSELAVLQGMQSHVLFQHIDDANKPTAANPGT